MNKIYGYARISTAKQSIARQIANIEKECAEAEIYAEAFTGTKSDRPEWNKLLKKVKTGDTIIFDSVSRMSRNAEEGIKQYFDLYDKGINLVFLKEHYIDTATYNSAKENAVPMTNTAVDCILQGVNEYLTILAKEQIKIAFEQAEKEVTDLHVRTSEGMKAKHAGAKISESRTGNTYETKKSKEMKGKIRKMAKCYEGNMTDREVMEVLGLARNTYYKYKREMEGKE